MDLQMNSKVFVFDLDDTLYKEIDFLKSGYKRISLLLENKNCDYLANQMFSWFKAGDDVFEKLMIKYDVTKELLLNTYRYHFPDISIENDVILLLNVLRKNRAIIGLITDGRSITQRNKLKALKIEEIFDDIIISEEFGSDKLDDRNFLYFQEKYPGRTYIYIGDNTQKDFMVPNKLNWNTYCLYDDGRNIHTQTLQVGKNMMPKVIIKEISDLINYL